jgi:hypothetical protein
MSSAAQVPQPMSKLMGADPARSAPQPVPQTIRAAGAACAVGIHAPAGAKRRAARRLEIIDRGKWGKSCSLKFGLIVTPVSPKGRAVVVITRGSKECWLCASLLLPRPRGNCCHPLPRPAVGPSARGRRRAGPPGWRLWVARPWKVCGRVDSRGCGAPGRVCVPCARRTCRLRDQQRGPGRDAWQAG